MQEPAANGTHPRAAGSFEQFMEHSPKAMAVTGGAEHALLYANLAFRQLTAVDTADIGRPITDAIAGGERSGLTVALDRVFRTGVVARDLTFASMGESTATWHGSVWSGLNSVGRPEHLVIELWESSQSDLTLALQREVAERLLLSSLRERDATDRAEQSSRRATFLAAEGRRLAESLDETATRETLASLTLPSLAAWCIVDILDDAGAMQRLRIVHPNAKKQALLRDLEGQWLPQPGDLFGLPAASRRQETTMIAAKDVDAALVASARGPGILRVLRAIEIGPLLTVPLVIRGTLLGAITFVSHEHDRGFSREEVALSEDLAVRSAIALDSAKLHGTALGLKTIAEAASQAKTAFLGTMSHELRTPLNAIGGYVDLILMGLRGPVSEAQQIDLGRIRRNQRHLLALITDLLNFVRVSSGRISYEIGDVIAHDVVASTVAMVDALIIKKGIICDPGDRDPGIVARADPEKVQQILINLLSNAIKFTPAGGRITVDYLATEQTVRIRIADTGVGIPVDKLEAIFDPFVQVRDGFAGRDTGVGLGLAISRDLARAMKGDLGVESELGRGSCFTLVLPRASDVHDQH